MITLLILAFIPLIGIIILSFVIASGAGIIFTAIDIAAVVFLFKLISKFLFKGR